MVLSVAQVAPCPGSVSSYTSNGSTYSFVTFNAIGSCSWTVPAAVTSVDALVVGGGGGGGAWVGGGRGGGGGGAATYWGTNYTSTGGDGGDGVVIIR